MKSLVGNQERFAKFVFTKPFVTSLCSYLNAFKKMLIRQFGIFISVTSAIFRGAFVKFDYTSNLTKVFKSLSEKYFKMSTRSLLRKCSMIEDEVNLSIKWLFWHIITSLSQYSTSSWSAAKRKSENTYSQIKIIFETWTNRIETQCRAKGFNGNLL